MSPQLLLLTGGPASGKTQLAARLAHHYDACCCSKDQIKELLFDTLGEGDAQWSRRLSDASFAVLFAYAPRLLTVQRLLIMEGNFRPAEHEPALAAALRASGAALAQVLCRAETAVRIARLAARASDPQRHPGHRDRDLEPAAGEPAAGAADFLDLPGPRWRYRSDLAGEGEWLALCRHLDRWRS